MPANNRSGSASSWPATHQSIQFDPGAALATAPGLPALTSSFGFYPLTPESLDEKSRQDDAGDH